MSSTLQAIIYVLAFLASGAGVVGYFKANVSKSTIDLYKEDNDALRTRLVTLEEDKRTTKAKISALEDANKFLGQVVTQADNIAYVKKAVDRNTDLLNRIAGAVGA